MIYPKKNSLVSWFFHGYILSLIKKWFHEVSYNVVETDPAHSVLLLANHFSWWDGFLLYYINYKVLKKRFHIMILEETVARVGFFKYMGAFSIRKNSREAITSLNFAAELLNDPQNLVLIFPQGKLYSNFADQVSFEKGLQQVTRKAAGKFQLVMVATFIEHMQYQKPSATVYLEKMGADKLADAADLQDIYNRHYDTARRQQNQITV